MIDGLVSVIIPCYNQGLFLKDSVGSVLNQTYQNFEIIIIDDGSSDNTAQITEELMAIDQRVKYYHQKNQGLSVTRNNGYKKANGEYIQFLDADDIIHVNKFREQILLFESDKTIDVCYTNFQTLDGNTGNFTGRYANAELSDNPLSDLLFRWERGLSIPIHCALFKKTVYSNNMPFITQLQAKEDWVMWITLALNNAKFVFLDKDYAFYRMHDLNMCKNSYDMTKNIISAVSYISSLLSGELKDDFKKESDFLIRTAYIPLLKRPVVSTFFIDTGNGFNDNESLRIVNIDFDNILYASVQTDNYSNIRSIGFSPLNGEFSKFKILDIETDGDYQGNKWSNSINETDGWDLFLTHYPLYVFNGNFSGMTWFKIKGEVDILEPAKISEYFSYYSKELSQTQSELNYIINTRTWRWGSKIAGIVRLIVPPNSIRRKLLKRILFLD